MNEHAGRGPVRVRAIGALGLGGLGIVAVLAVAAGLLLPGRQVPVGPGSTTVPIGPVTTITVRLVTPDSYPPARADLDLTVEIMRARLASVDAAGSKVAAVPPDRVTVELAESADSAEVRALLMERGRFEFVPLPSADYGTIDAPGPKEIPDVGSPIDPALAVLLTGSDIDATTARAVDQTKLNGGWGVRFDLTAEGTATFAEWSTAHQSEFFAFVLDGTVVSAPYVGGPITDGGVVINNEFSADEARRLAATMKLGSLPVPVTELSVTASSDRPGTSGGSSGVAPLATPSAASVAGLVTTGRSLGDAKAPATLDIWVDFRCTACGVFVADTEPRLIEAYVRTGKLRIVYHDFLVIDTNTGATESRDAANAARCAEDQGKFWDFKQWLFANQSPTESAGSFSLDRLVEIGRAAGLDMGAYEPCVRRGTHDNAVTADQPSIAVTGVPTILFNGSDMGIQGRMPTYDELAAAIDAAVRGAAARTPAATPAALD
jgi:protein-disulfide isomerase